MLHYSKPQVPLATLGDLLAFTFVTFFTLPLLKTEGADVLIPIFCTGETQPPERR
jgi:hypothetical protein